MRQLLFLLLTGMLLPVVAQADDVLITLDGFRYALNIDKNKGTAEVTGVGREQDDRKEIVIPESFTYEGSSYRATSIGSYACVDIDLNGAKITSLTIPNSVTCIGEYNQEIKGETNVEIVPVIV